MATKVALVAGGGGFLGSHLTERLIADGWSVRVVDLLSAPIEANLASIANDPRLSVERADVTEVAPTDSLFTGVSEIFNCIMAGHHLASRDNPEAIFPPNLMPTLRLLEAARAQPGTRFHQTSSAAVYGRLSGCIDETAPTDPDTPYGLVKCLQEQSVAYWNHMYGVPAVTYRLFACYGPRATSGGVFAIFLRKLHDGQPLTLTGDGSSQRDFIHVRDVVDAFVRVSATDVSSGAFNVGTGQLTTLKHLAELMGGPIEYVPARAVDEPVYADIRSLTDATGWTPAISVEDGVPAVVREAVPAQAIG
jgi:UDP-glucose 4-epimerase